VEVAGLERGQDVLPEDTLEAIRELGFYYVDLAMFEGWTHVSPSKLRKPEKHGTEIASVCERVGIQPIAIHANFNPRQEEGFPGLTVADERVRAKLLEQFERVVACAVSGGVPLVNVQPGHFLDDMPRRRSLDHAVALLKAMQRTAKRRGVTLTFENHSGSIAEQPEDALYLLESVEGLRLDYDPSHVVAQSIPVESTRTLMPYVAHVGIRNAKPGNYNLPMGEEGLDYDGSEFIGYFREYGVNAYVSVEYFEPSMRPEIPKLKDWLRQRGVASR
jgi:sugar phosphate isomerase/epimerase